MSETPRTDAMERVMFDEAMERRRYPGTPAQEPTERYAILCRELERDLQQANAALNDASVFVSHSAGEGFKPAIEWFEKHRPAIERAKEEG